MFYHDSCKWHSYANVIQLVRVHLSTFAPSLDARVLKANEGATSR